MLSRCGHEIPDDRMFCPDCGKVRNLAELKTVRLPGFVGVFHSTSPAVEQFLATGDPNTPGL